jgi:hypothetical protein
MLLPENEALLFLRVYQDLITYSARCAGGIQGIVDKRTWEAARMAAKAEARDHLLDHVDIVAAYIAENPDGLPEEILAQVGEEALRPGQLRRRTATTRSTSAVFLHSVS